MEISNVSEEEELKEKICMMTPLTPAKPTDSVNRGGISSNSVGLCQFNTELLVGFDSSNSSTTISPSVHVNKHEIVVSSGEFNGDDGLMSNFCSVSSGNLSNNGVNLTALHDDVRVTSEGVQDSSAGLGSYQDNSKVKSPNTGVVDSKLFDGNSERGFGLSSVAPSTPANKPSSKKRVNNGVDMNKKPPKRPKMKRHRPKIYDESKPRKIPKSQTAKNPRTAPSEKRKYVRRVNQKASVSLSEEVEGQGVITTTKLKTEDEGKLGKSLIYETREPSTLNPLTPERSIPKHVISMDSPCERRELLIKDAPELSVNLLKYDNGQEINENSDHGAKSCRRALNFIVEDQVQNKNEEQLSFKWGLNIQPQDFDFCPGLNKIVNQYRRGKRSLRKSQRKCSTNLNSKTQDLNSRIGLENELEVDYTPLSNEVDCQYKPLKVYQRVFRPNECVKNSRKSGPNFPKLFKKKRSERQRITNCSRLWNDLTTDEGQIEVRKRSLGLSTVSDINSHSSLMGRILRPRKQPRTAVTDMISSKRLQRLRRTMRSRRKRRILSIPKLNLSVKSSKSYGSKQAKDMTVNYEELYSTGQPFSFLVTTKKRSKSSIRRRNFQSLSTLAVQASNFRSQRINNQEYEACGNFLNVNNQIMLRNGWSHEDRLVIDHEKIEKDPPKRSKSFIRRRNIQLPSTFVVQASDFRSQRINNHESEACGDFLDINNQITLRNVESHADRLVIDHEMIERDPLECNGRLLELYHQENQNGLLNSMRDYVHQEDVTSNYDVKACCSECYGGLQISSSEAESTKALTNCVNQESEPLPNQCTQLVAQDQDVGAILPYEGKIDPSKKKKPQPKVDIDPETMRMWKLLMENEESKVTEDEKKEKDKWWEEQRKIFGGRVDSFLAIMHLIQGNRRFSPWKGSVVDSVVGAFLTQNVSDHLSSSAFMSLRARFPPKVTSNHEDDNKDSTSIDVSDKSSTGVDMEDAEDEHARVLQSEQNIDLRCGECIEESIVCAEASGLVEDEIGDNASQQHDFACSSDSSVAAHAFSLLERPDAFRQILESEENDFLQKFQKGEFPFVSEENSLTTISEIVTFPNEHLDSSIKNIQLEKKSRRKKGKMEEKQQAPVDWDQLRKTYSSSRVKDATGNTRDAIDWEAVRQATDEEVAATIAVRGQQRVIGSRIKELLDRLVKDHGSIDLEWLRDVPPDKAKEYLLSIKGLGLKSVECIRLLALHHMAFPVDVNVGRVAVRLGWVPLEPLPEDLQIHLLNQYPMMDSIQKYLWPRLCTLDQRTLYELHYQLITFGKVFCTKIDPNCNACPMRGECRHFASAFASARLRLPGPQQKGIVTSTVPIAADQEPFVPMPPPAILSLPDSNSSESVSGILDCEPTVEFPKSPEPEPTEIPVRDIEDFYYDSGDEIPLIKLNDEVFKENLLNFVDKTEAFLQEGNVSQALVALSLEAASVPVRKLKNVNRLRTEHQVYELPDSHPLLAGLAKREPDDPCPYLLAISTTGESSNSFEQLKEPWKSNKSDFHDLPKCSEKDVQIVRGTIFVPCRTAEKGSFPLNGTYFQVNEVFADHESSESLIDIPRSWLWNLPMRTLYCGTSASAIFKGLSLEEIQHCFWRGFICVRGFDRETGNPKPLSQRFHVSTTMAMLGKKKQAGNE